MEIGEIKERYGELYAPSQPDDILYYFYNYKKGKFLEKNSPETEKEARNIFIFSSMFHEGYVDTLLFMDSYYASSGK